MAKPVGEKLRNGGGGGGACKEGGQPVHATRRKPVHATTQVNIADFEYGFTIPTSGNILPCLLLLQPIPAVQLPFILPGTA